MTTPRYLLAPGLERLRVGERNIIRNPRIGTRVELGAILEFLIEHYSEPCSLAPLAERLGGSLAAPPPSLATLLDNFVLVAEADLESLAHGIVNPVSGSEAIGRAVKLRELRELGDEAGARYGVVGAPWDAGGGRTNQAGLGPAALRRAFEPHGPALRVGPGAGGCVHDFEFRRRYTEPPRALDLGDIVVKPTQALAAAGRRLEFVTALILDAGLVPVTLGGDHSLSYFTIGALLDRHERLGILHFDAHHDAWPPVQDELLTHANPMHFLLQDPRVVRLHQLGVRVVDTLASEDRIEADARMSFISARELLRLEPGQALEQLPRDIPYYLSFDLDCLAPHWCSSVDTPEAGGLSYYQALELVDLAVRELEVVGLDFVELGADRDPGGRDVAAKVGARLLLSALLGPSPFEELGSYRIAKPTRPLVRSGS